MTSVPRDGSDAAADPRHVALLRGINVGGKNKLPMRDLRRLFEAAGARNVRSYIQSGNVLFEASPAAASELLNQVRQSIEAEFGLRIPLVLRTVRELEQARAANPFPSAAPEKLIIMFLDQLPGTGATLDFDRSPPDAVELLGRELFLHAPNGIARTRFTNAYLDKALGVTTTGRNLRTLNQILELTED